MQIFVVVVLKNITIYVFLNVVFTLIYNLGCSYVTDKRYPQYKCKGKLGKVDEQKIKRNIFALAINKIGDTVSLSLDTIVISAYLGLTVVAVYGNYSYIVSAISGFVILIYGAVTAGIGNSMVLETKEKNYGNFNKFVYLNTWLVDGVPYASCAFFSLS